ncbi:hypothetical protein BE04_20375 [Sorangium cellulosum]|uniref:Uncharacterized protein n=1 Tax=Sorangium cellulosum TaxID=56 RepID=A0A150PQX0_SORCE|nr:hypothetical protein BE04_20375 [Sorangium cellulosum]
MRDSIFLTLEAAIADEHFPEVDLMLRRGRHVGRDDGTAYDYLGAVDLAVVAAVLGEGRCPSAR